MGPSKANSRCFVFVGACAAGRGHFGANHKQQVVAFFGTNPRQIGGAGGGLIIGQLSRFAGAPFRTVEVNFSETGFHILAHQHACFVHCLISWHRAPSLWAEMIAAKDNAFAVHLGAIRDLIHKPKERFRRHAGVATILIDLIGRGLNHNLPVAALGQIERGAQDVGMGRAHRWDGRSLARPVLGNDIAQGIAHFWVSCQAA